MFRVHFFFCTTSISLSSWFPALYFEVFALDSFFLQKVFFPNMISNSSVSPPKAPLSQYSSLLRLMFFLPSLILFKCPRLSPPFLLKFLLSASVPVLIPPNFQTPSDLEQPETPEIPASPQPPKNQPRLPPRLLFDVRRSRPQKCRQAKPRPKDKPSVTDVEAAWSAGIYPYSLVEHAAAPRRRHIPIQSLCNWYG